MYLTGYADGLRDFCVQSAPHQARTGARTKSLFCFVFSVHVRTQQAVEPMWIVSMMMSAGGIYLKCGGLIWFPLLTDQKNVPGLMPHAQA